jgi:hypothetical protein
LGARSAQQPEVRTGSHRARCQVHQRGVRNITVGKDHHVHLFVADDLFHPVFLEDGNAAWI